MTSRLLNTTWARSTIASMRERRLAPIRSFLAAAPAGTRVLDVGGTPAFWTDLAGIGAYPEVHVTVLNLTAPPASAPNVETLVGDGTAMPQYGDGEFSLVFSNSVLEHVGDLAAQGRMAAEVRRIGQAYFVQVPNRRFVLEPHFVFPGFQFLPPSSQRWLLCHFALGNYQKAPSPEVAQRYLDGVRLLDTREMRSLFPDATISFETVAGLRKSIIASRGITLAP